MDSSIIGALISGGITLVGTVITVLMANKKTTADMKISQAVTDTKLSELTREVREHNNFAQRMPVVEEKLKVVDHRLSDLEKQVNG